MSSQDKLMPTEEMIEAGFGALPHLALMSSDEMRAIITAALNARPTTDVSTDVLEERFWEIVDRDGLTGLPSDMWAALEILASNRATIEALETPNVD